MFDVAISELTSVRWELHEELAHAAAVGFDAISLWRPKVSDAGVAETARLLATSGVAASSLQWAGGFTGGDGRSFAESVADAVDAITVAEAVGAPVLVVHSGCRGGHTRSHATRLLSQALEMLAPRAAAAGVTLAIRPVHPLAAPGCSFVTQLADALDLVEQFDDSALRLAVDLWQFGGDHGIDALLPRLAAAAAVVQVADRIGEPSAAADRLPAGSGDLPLEQLVAGLLEAGYRGVVEFDPVGEAVESMGYAAAWRQTRAAVGGWRSRLASEAACGSGACGGRTRAPA
jgi:sugar phosphate isomerase/epimerase